jgi:hypothetical protein
MNPQEMLDQIGSILRSGGGPRRRRGGDEGPEEASEEARAKQAALSGADSVPEDSGAAFHTLRIRDERNHQSSDELGRNINRRTYDAHAAAAEQMAHTNAAEYSFQATIRMLALGSLTSVPGVVNNQIMNMDIAEGAALRGLLQQGQSGATAIEAIRAIIPVWTQLAASRGISAETLSELILSEAAKTSTKK